MSTFNSFIDMVSKTSFYHFPISDSREDEEYDDARKYHYIILDKKDGWNRKLIQNQVRELKKNLPNFDIEFYFIREEVSYQVNFIQQIIPEPNWDKLYLEEMESSYTKTEWIKIKAVFSDKELVDMWKRVNHIED